MNTTTDETEIRARIRAFILASINIPDLADDDNLFESGIVNSLFAVELMTFLEKSFGILNEAFGRGRGALTDLLRIQAIGSMSVLRWRSAEQKSRRLPPLARGEIIGAFALTESGGGSDLQALQTQFTECGDGAYRLS